MERNTPESRLLRRRFGRLSRGRVEVTGGFLLLVAWLNYLDSQGIVPLALFSCALHELGHLLAVQRLGGRIRRLSITAVGAEMEVDRALSYGREAAAALAGPLVNLALALFACRVPGGRVFAGLNLVLACFNLLPIGHLDGGRVLRCLTVWLLGPETAWWIGRQIDQWLVGALLFLGILLAQRGNSVTLLLTALWLVASLMRETHFLERPMGTPGRRR